MHHWQDQQGSSSWQMQMQHSSTVEVVPDACPAGNVPPQHERNVRPTGRSPRACVLPSGCKPCSDQQHMAPTADCSSISEPMCQLRSTGAVLLGQM
jgi:hypothetical protein